MKLPSAERALLSAAKKARERAYAPYSRFKVGAAVLLASGDTTTGVNVENCSFGLTVCAERNAVAAAVREGARPGDVVAVAIVARAHRLTPPCGACRQVLVEFCRPGARVLMHNLENGRTAVMTIDTLLPQAFRPDNMRKS